MDKNRTITITFKGYDLISDDYDRIIEFLTEYGEDVRIKESEDEE